MKPIDGVIVTTTTNNNYGNIVQRYALQKFLQKNGYNFVSYYFYGFYWRVFFIKLSVFSYPLRGMVARAAGKNKQHSSGAYNYRKLSSFCTQRIEQRLYTTLVKKRYDTYITGSDQNLGTSIKYEFFTSWQNFLLRFVTWDAKRISYASSFGKAKLGEENSFIKSNVAKSLVQKFNAFSVREKSGIEIAKKIWGIDARQVVDPALLLRKDDYDYLINNPTTSVSATKPVFFYLLRTRDGDDLFNFTAKIADDLGLKMDGCLTHGAGQMKSMEQWLKGYRDSQLVITNSFHGVLMSLINNTDFIVLYKRKDESNAVRFQDILGILGLDDRVVFDDEFRDFDVRNLPQIDWRGVNEKVSKLRDDSAEWLLSELRRA